MTRSRRVEEVSDSVLDENDIERTHNNDHSSTTTTLAYVVSDEVHEELDEGEREGVGPSGVVSGDHRDPAPLGTTPECPVTIEDVGPEDPSCQDNTKHTIYKVFKTREEDLAGLDRESAVILNSALRYNKTVSVDLLKEGDDHGEEEDNTDVVVCDGVVLTEAERDLLSLGPGFMVLDKLDKQEMRIESSVTMTKVRWGRRKLGTEEMTGKQEDEELLNIDEEDLKLSEALELEARDVLSDTFDCVDMRNKRATDMKGNRSVMMPGPAPALTEAEYSTRMEAWHRAFDEYRANNCKEDGEQLVSNLSANQLLGMKTLGKKVSKRELVVLEADKGKRFVVVTEATYISMAEDHTTGDRKVDREEVRESQRILSYTAKALANTFDLGSNHSSRNYNRCLDNCGSSANDVPTLRILPKVHKAPGPRGHLQSRPVVAASGGISARAGDQLADFLSPLVASQRPRMEDLSTEEVMEQLEQAQRTMKETKARNIMVGSLDVKALYPSLDQEGSARAVANFVKESPTEVKGIDWRSAQVFVASNMDEFELKREGLTSLVPRRCKKFGPRPGKTTHELGAKKYRRPGGDGGGGPSGGVSGDHRDPAPLGPSEGQAGGEAGSGGGDVKGGVSGDHRDPATLDPSNGARGGGATPGGAGHGPRGGVSGDHRDPAPLGPCSDTNSRSGGDAVTPGDSGGGAEGSVSGDQRDPTTLDPPLDQTRPKVVDGATCGTGGGPRGGVSGDHRHPAPLGPSFGQTKPGGGDGTTRATRQPSKWEDTNPDAELSEEDKRKLLAAVMLVATRNVFKYHVYSFAGQVYRQTKGGPIGLRFTSIVARIVMDVWLALFLRALMDAGVKILGAMKYVDDINLVLSMVALGTRWVEGALVHTEKWEEEDMSMGATIQSVTMRAMRTAADSVIPWLQFTSDEPTQHAGGMVPILDIQAWVRPADPELEDDHDTLAWVFYQKPTATKRVLLASSAYNWRCKIVTLTMEVFRWMKNCTRQMTTRARTSLMEEFILKLRKSGYVAKTVEGIVTSGLKFYQRKVSIDLQGGPPLYIRSEQGTLQRRRQKLGASEQWFNRRRGGGEEQSRKENGWRSQNQHNKNRNTREGSARGRRTLKYPKQGPVGCTARGPGGEEGGGPSGGVSGDHRDPAPLGTPHPNHAEDNKRQPRVTSTLLVPFTIGSRLKDKVQEADRKFVELLGGGHVRVVEKGGTLLAHILCRPDPWATGRSCDDSTCNTCWSKRWLQEQKKVCKQEGTELPKVLLQKTANHCTKEGVNYSLQCLHCALEGVASIYWGESGLSARQRHKNHFDQVEKGDVRNPMVIHSVEMHGGKKPLYLSLINAIEPKPVYRAVRESVQISGMPEGPTTLNRCQEWGAPRVPILQVTGGGDDPSNTTLANLPNERREWSRDMLDKINNGACKRIIYWDHSGVVSGDHGDPDPLLVPDQHNNPPKRRKTDPAPNHSSSSSSSLRNMSQEEHGGGPSGCVSGDHRDPTPLGTTPPPDHVEPEPVLVLGLGLGRDGHNGARQQQQQNTKLDENPRLEEDPNTTGDNDKDHTPTTTTMSVCVVPHEKSGENPGSVPREGVSGDHRDPSLPGTSQVQTTSTTPRVEGNGKGTAMTAALATGTMPSMSQTRPGAAVRAAPNPAPNTPASSNPTTIKGTTAVKTTTETAKQQAANDKDNVKPKPEPKPRKKLVFGATDIRLKNKVHVQVHKDNREKNVANVATDGMNEDAAADIVVVPANNDAREVTPVHADADHDHVRLGARTKRMGPPPPRNPGLTPGPRQRRGPPGNPLKGRGSRGPRAPGLLAMDRDRRSSQNASLMRWLGRDQGKGLRRSDGPEPDGSDGPDVADGVEGGPGPRKNEAGISARPPRDASNPEEASSNSSCSRRLDHGDTGDTRAIEGGGEGAAEGKDKKEKEEKGEE